jgi:hypothetical protein
MRALYITVIGKARGEELFFGGGGGGILSVFCPSDYITLNNLVAVMKWNGYGRDSCLFWWTDAAFARGKMTKSQDNVCTGIRTKYRPKRYRLNEIAGWPNERIILKRILQRAWRCGQEWYSTAIPRLTCGQEWYSTAIPRLTCGQEWYSTAIPRLTSDPANDFFG